MQINNDIFKKEVQSICKRLATLPKHGVNLAELPEYMRMSDQKDMFAKHDLSPLHYAIACGYNNIALYFVKNNMFINDVDNKKRTPLSYALGYKKMDLAKEIHIHGGKSACLTCGNCTDLGITHVIELEEHPEIQAPKKVAKHHTPAHTDEALIHLKGDHSVE